MTGPMTYDEACGMPWPDVLNRYQALNDRDAMARAIATLQARGEWNADRSLDPEDYPPLTAAEHLELLALGEVIARHYRHPALVHHAVLAGCDLGGRSRRPGAPAPDQRGQAYRGVGRGSAPAAQDFPGGTIGLGDEEYAAALKAAGESGRGSRGR